MLAGNFMHFLKAITGELFSLFHSHSVNFVKISKYYQISEVVNRMKDLIGFCRDQKVGPIGNAPISSSSAT